MELSSPNLTSITPLIPFRKALKTLFEQFVAERLQKVNQRYINELIRLDLY